MSYTILAAEIAQPQYAGLTDAEIATALNTPGAATRRSVSISDLQAEALRNGAYIAIDTAALAAETPAELRAVCRAVLALVNARFDAINLDDPMAQQMFAALTAAGILSASRAAAIDALADVPGMTRAQVLGLAGVSEADIQAVRQWQAAQDAEAARLAAFAALRERLVNGYHGTLAWLQMQQDGGQAAPEWDAVVARM